MAPKLQFAAKTVIDQGRVPRETFEELKQWCLLQNLPVLSDEQLILFLLSCYNVLDATKNTIHAYFKCKHEAPELFYNRNMEAEDVLKACKTCEFAVFPVKTANNEAVVMLKLQESAYYKFHLEAIMKTLLMVGELTLYQDPPDGLVQVIDMKGFGLLHLTRLRIGPLRKFFQYVQEGVPCRLKQIHVLNTVYFIDKIMKIVKPFMKEELYNMIKFHPAHMKMGDFFEKYLPMDCLPEDYGGSLPKLNVLSCQTYDMIRGLERFYRDEEEQVRSYKMKK
ncbi:uncharacterized protein BDFB_009187 [Asbolus verrucosus]|uniref:CRAL-TRIO domain-containing protein n=1 Tax=Asbolus verrucosus TaxID=1661398 RepID=A0A482VAL4_ASBVE|nr:uncharacterized protein BDFB_009187 [Asbolus verrucosus]